MITDFIKTTKTKEELSTAFNVLMEFKKCENITEWCQTPFMCWSKLEQLEEFLKHLVNGESLNADTIRYMESEKEINNEH